MIESILSLICWVWLPALLYHCIIRSRGSSPGFMNELTLRQRLGDGTDPTVMSCHRDKEKRGSFMKPPIHWFRSLSRSFFFFCPPLTQLSHPSPTQDAFLLSSPALSRPAHPCLFQPNRLWPWLWKSQFHTHALAHRQRRPLIWCVCVYVCLCESL